uniref:TORC_N domain-containing protein n=1 Tax=Strongyloides papillosus TaxID=174720 RepID=A0A0N5BA69_STREA
MRDLQKAVEDVMIKPEQNRLEDIRQRSTLAALDLCEPISSNNNKNMVFENDIYNVNNTTPNNINLWKDKNLVMGLADSSLPMRNNYFQYNSNNFDMTSNNINIFSNNTNNLYQPRQNDISPHVSMYNSFENILLRSSSSMSANINFNDIKTTNSNINELTINGLIESRNKRSNSVSSCCPTKGSKHSITTFDDISEINSDKCYNSLQISTTSSDDLDSAINEYRKSDEEMDFE